MTYNALKSIDLTKFLKVLMYFLVSCSNGGGHVSPVRTMVFHRNLLSFSSFVHFKIMWLTVCSSFILQEHVKLGINLNLWRYEICVCVHVCAFVCWGDVLLCMCMVIQYCTKCMHIIISIVRSLICRARQQYYHRC